MGIIEPIRPATRRLQSAGDLAARLRTCEGGIRALYKVTMSPQQRRAHDHCEG